MGRLWTLTLCLLSVPALLFAQEVITPPNFVDVGAKLIVAVTPVLTVVAVWLLKLFWSKIPASVVLILAPIAGVGIEYALSYLASHPSPNPLVAAALGALGVYLREFATTIQTKGFSGAITITKGML